MRLLIAAFALASIAGCVSSGEVDQDQAWIDCKNKRDKAQRTQCMTQQLSAANQRRDAEMQSHEDDVAAEEAEAAVEQAYGVPADKAGGPIRPATRP